MASDFRERLRARMAALGMLDADVIRRTGLNPTFMNKLWKGNDPSITNASKIARAVGWTLGELYDDGMTPCR